MPHQHQQLVKRDLSDPSEHVFPHCDPSAKKHKGDDDGLQVIAKPTSNQCLPPMIIVPRYVNRQPSSVHTGMTIEEMTKTVVAFLNSNNYSYTLPNEYVHDSYVHTTFDYFVPRCTVEVHYLTSHDKKYSNHPPIVFTEAYKATTSLQPQSRNTTPASIIWYGFKTNVTNADEITTYLELCHKRFVIDDA